ncbi:hypothetical protein [Desulfovibrio intestinalis]|uniref:Uncharacterized protein n=1 Tax=Desulfovibrio intestinalis TaxID=58621 RepID=A0A7W8FG30_9BACT|nr:hypothetical protein [Desulfovibrio intestinalis]MBB5142397.1 hypothetical protein [Desulfovibrio intestinalis]
MSHPPNVPPNNPGDEHLPHDERLPVPAERQAGNANAGDEQRRVIDAEIIFDSSHEQEGAHHQGQTFGPNGGQGSQNGYNQNDAQGRFYRRTFNGGNFGGFQAGSPLGQIWMTGSGNSNACLAPCVTFAIFLVCLAQLGFLAGLGFVFFHTIGSIVGTLRQMRLMTTGVMPNPWLWRMSNWVLSFFLTAWLAGGFD